MKEKKIFLRTLALQVITYFMIPTLISVSFAEIALRLAGYKPWQIEEPSIAVTPGGRLYEKNSTLGYTNLPGTYTVYLSQNYSFQVTHLDNHLRATHPLKRDSSSSQKEEIWIFGCSFTYGWSVSDRETYPWRLQEQFPHYEVANFGMNGYGTIHSLIQFQEALKTRRKPQVAIIAYAGFHDRRNTFLRARRKQMAAWNKLGVLFQPAARLSSDNRLTYDLKKLEYREFPLMRVSALMHLLEINYNQLEDVLYRSHEVSKAILQEFDRVAKEQGVQLVVAGINPGSATMLAELEKMGIRTVDISVNLKIPQNNNLPHDLHPSAIAHQQYAQKLGSFLQQTVLKETAGFKQRHI